MVTKVSDDINERRGGVDSARERMIVARDHLKGHCACDRRKDLSGKESDCRGWRHICAI